MSRICSQDGSLRGFSPSAGSDLVLDEPRQPSQAPGSIPYSGIGRSQPIAPLPIRLCDVSAIQRCVVPLKNEVSFHTFIRQNYLHMGDLSDTIFAASKA